MQNIRFVVLYDKRSKMITQGQGIAKGRGRHIARCPRKAEVVRASKLRAKDAAGT